MAPKKGRKRKPPRKRTRNPTAPRIGFVIFQSDNGKYYVDVMLGDGPANVQGGYGGWEVKQRPRRRAFTLWQGNEPLQIDIPILIDYFVLDGEGGGTQCEHDIRQLEKMAGLEGGMREPPLITFDAGGAIPHDYTHADHLDWVITNIEWSDPVERNTSGDRLRQAATVSVMQFIEDDQLQNESAAQRRKGQKKRKQRGKRHGADKKIYTVKMDPKTRRAETLQHIAHNELGNSKRWHEIAKLNSIRDPNHLRIGQKLRLP